MKNIFNIILVLFFISACEIIDYDYDTYTIKNDTEYTVNIMAYDKYHNNSVDSVVVEWELVKLSDDITIEPYDNYSVEKETGEVESPPGAFSRNQVDSVIITFNNTKRITYVCKNLHGLCIEQTRSIINWQFYEFEYVKNRGHDYTYTITQEDYDNAELIE